MGEKNKKESVDNDRTKCIFSIIKLCEDMGSGQRRVAVKEEVGQMVSRLQAGLSTVSRERQNASERRAFILYQEPADARQVMLLSSNN